MHTHAQTRCTHDYTHTSTNIHINLRNAGTHCLPQAFPPALPAPPYRRQGGGWCGSDINCLERANSTLGSSKHWPATYTDTYEGSQLFVTPPFVGDVLCKNGDAVALLVRGRPYHAHCPYPTSVTGQRQFTCACVLTNVDCAPVFSSLRADKLQRHLRNVGPCRRLDSLLTPVLERHKVDFVEVACGHCPFCSIIAAVATDAAAAAADCPDFAAAATAHSPDTAAVTDGPRYCDGGSWTGHADAPVSVGGSTIYYRGRLLLDELLSQALLLGLASASNLLYAAAAATAAVAAVVALTLFPDPRGCSTFPDPRGGSPATDMRAAQRAV